MGGTPPPGHRTALPSVSSFRCFVAASQPASQDSTFLPLYLSLFHSPSPSHHHRHSSSPTLVRPVCPSQNPAPPLTQPTHKLTLTRSLLSRAPPRFRPVSDVRSNRPTQLFDSLPLLFLSFIHSQPPLRVRSQCNSPHPLFLVQFVRAGKLQVRARDPTPPSHFRTSAPVAPLAPSR